MKKVVMPMVVICIIATLILSGCTGAGLTAETDARLYLKDMRCVKDVISSESTPYDGGYKVSIKWNPCNQYESTKWTTVYVNSNGDCSFSKW